MPPRRDEVREQRSVLPRFRVPLHADDEPLRGILDPLQGAVAGPGRLDEPVSESTDSLMVVGGDVGARPDHRRQSGSVLHLDGMLGEDAWKLLVLVARNLLGEVLDEIAAARDVQQLKSAADRERRHVLLERCGEQSQFPRVAARLRHIRLRMRLGAVERRVDVGAPGEHNAVQRLERLRDALLARWDQDRTPARSLDRVDVVERDQRGREVPDSPAAAMATMCWDTR